MSNNTYTPDKWVLLKYTTGEVCVFAGWGGGYTYGQSWKRSTPIVSAKLDDDEETYVFKCESGSTYACRASSYGMTAYMNAVVAPVLEAKTGTILDEDWVFDWYLHRLRENTDDLVHSKSNPKEE